VTYEIFRFHFAAIHSGGSNSGSGAAQLFDNLICDEVLATTYIRCGQDLYNEEPLTALSLIGAKFGTDDMTDYEAAAVLIAGDWGSLPGL